MSDEPFDPYQNWLEISATNRPLSHYQLLKLDDFENDLNKINSAIDRQATTLQLITGKDVETAKQLLAEVGQARLCLTSASRKQDYDAALKKAGGSGANVQAEITIETAKDASQGVEPTGDENFAEIRIVTEKASQLKADENNAPLESPNQNDVTAASAAEPLGSDESSLENSGKPANDNQNDFVGIVVDSKSDASAQKQPSSADLSGLSGLGDDLQAERIESQKAKEKQDETIKLIMDKVLWISCGICVIAIIGVFISRSNGCNREPIVSDTEEMQESFSRKMGAQQHLEGGFKSNIFSESEKAKLLGQGKSRSNGDVEPSEKQNESQPKKLNEQTGPKNQPKEKKK